MKFKSLCLLVVFSFAGCTTVSAGQSISKVSDQLRQKVQKDGIVRVSVMLNVPTNPEVILTQDEIIAQRQTIGVAQNRVLQELEGTKYQLLGMLTTIAGMGLSVDADALAILDKSSMVQTISESIYTPPQKYDLREIKP